MTEASASPYEALPHDLGPYPELHPARLDLVSQLGGGPALPLDGSFRWLELGCGAGLSLVPLGLEFPAAELVGVDREPGHIARATTLKEALGAHNVSLIEGDLFDLPEALGRFDVIVLHRVYSHLTEAQQAACLAAVEGLLAPDGVVLLSFNALPGWHLRGAVREAVVYHTRSIPDPRVRVQQARAFVGFLASSVSPDEVVWHRTVTEEHERLQAASDTEVAHDLLADVNAPQSYESLVDEAAKVGLTPVGDAAFVDRLEERLQPGVLLALRTLTEEPIALQQAVDLCEGRAFRHTLLARRRATPTLEPLLAGVVRRLETNGPVPIPMRDVFARLPLSGAEVSVSSVVQSPGDARRLIGLMALGLAEWWPASRGAVAAVSPFPRATPGAVALAPQSWGALPSAWHHAVDVSPVERMIAGWLDGETSVDEIVERLVSQVMSDVFRIRGADGEPLRDPELLRPVLADVTQDALGALASQGLLVG